WFTVAIAQKRSDSLGQFADVVRCEYRPIESEITDLAPEVERPSQADIVDSANRAERRRLFARRRSFPAAERAIQIDRNFPLTGAGREGDMMPAAVIDRPSGQHPDVVIDANSARVVQRAPHDVLARATDVDPQHRGTPPDFGVARLRRV